MSKEIVIRVDDLEAGIRKMIEILEPEPDEKPLEEQKPHEENLRREK